MPGIPLTPVSGGGLCIPEQSLQPADLLVSTTAASISGVIRKATNSPVSHAMLYLGGGSVIEAIGEGVTERSLSAAIRDATLAVGYRVKGLNPAIAPAVVRFARQWVGKKYDALGALGGGAAHNLMFCAALGIGLCVGAHKGRFASEDKFYCSEVVFEAFRLAGVPLITRRSDISVPHDVVSVYLDGRLLYVGHLVA